MIPYGISLPEQLRDVLNIIICDNGTVHIRWKKPVAFTLQSEGQELFGMPLVTSELYVLARGLDDDVPK